MGLGQDTILPGLSIPLGKGTGLAQMNGGQAVTYGVLRGPMLWVGVRAMTRGSQIPFPHFYSFRAVEFSAGFSHKDKGLSS